MTRTAYFAIFAVFAIVWGIFAIGVSFAAPPALEKLAREVLAPVAQLDRNCSISVVYSNRDAKSGDVTTYLLTAKHCVNDSSGVIHDVYLPVYQDNRLVAEKLFKAKVFAQDFAGDLALLVLQDKDTLIDSVVRIAPADVALYEGEDVWAVGWSLAEVRTITRGTFGNRSSITFPNGSLSTEYFRATTEIAPGNSGGALFHMNADGRYEQIGVATASVRGAPFVTYWTPIDAIHTFLSRVAKDIVAPVKTAAK